MWTKPAATDLRFGFEVTITSLLSNFVLRIKGSHTCVFFALTCNIINNYFWLIQSYNDGKDFGHEFFKEFRDKQNQRGVVLWFTGLSGAGKTTITNELDQLLIYRRIMVTF